MALPAYRAAQREYRRGAAVLRKVDIGLGGRRLLAGPRERQRSCDSLISSDEFFAVARTYEQISKIEGDYEHSG
jgi:hypothetical protein